MANNNKKSFQRKIKPKIVSISGTKPSIHNSQLLISTGISSLDFVLGGGIPLGTLVLIEEDTYSEYSKYIEKHFLAEGLNNNNFVYVASLNEEPEEIIHNLPGLRAMSNVSDHLESKKLDNLEIAWRYKGQKSKNIEVDSYKSNYDTRKVMEVENLRHLIYTFGLNAENFSELKGSLFRSLITSIQSKIRQHELRPHPSKENSNALRIVLNSLLSPLWCSQENLCKASSKWKEILKFFTLLKAIVRSSFSVALITVPSKLIDLELMSALYGIVDFVLNLESFQGSEKGVNPLYIEYNGILNIKKLPVLNIIIPHIIDFKDWAFHLNKGSLTFTRLHLPPEDSDTASRAQEDGIITCSGSNILKLDF